MTKLVWVTDTDGNLKRVVEVIHFMEADRTGVVYEHNWRQAWIKETLKPGDLVLCDDGYVTGVRRVAYGRAFRFLHLDTGTFRLPDVQKNEHYKYEDPSSLRGVHITTQPVRAPFKTAEVDRHMLKLRAVARYYISNGFDLQAAWYRIFRRGLKKHKKTKAVFKSDRWRIALSIEAKRYFEKAHVTPTNVIQELYRRMCETEDNREALLLGHEIMRYHPDFEPNDMPLGGGRGNGLKDLKAKAWLGDATIVQAALNEANPVPSDKASQVDESAAEGGSDEVSD